MGFEGGNSAWLESAQLQIKIKLKNEKENFIIRINHIGGHTCGEDLKIVSLVCSWNSL